NTLPFVAEIPDQVISEGQSLLFTVLATDTNSPPQNISFALAPGAPSGAAINPDTGLFSWRPAANQAPATNSITVLAADDGQPPMMGARTFVVRVFARPRFNSIDRLSNGGLSLTFETITGRTYRLEYKNDLDDESWTPLGPDAMADGESLTITDPPANSFQRYYRIV